MYILCVHVYVYVCVHIQMGFTISQLSFSTEEGQGVAVSSHRSQVNSGSGSLAT